MKYNVVNFKERPDLYDLQDDICSNAFPVFLYYSEIADKYWEKMITYYKEYQLLLLEEDQGKGISSIAAKELINMCVKMGI